MNSKNSKTSDPQRLILNLTDKINLKRFDKYVVLSNLTIFLHMEKYKIQKYKISYRNIKFKISAPLQNDEFKLPDG